MLRLLALISALSVGVSATVFAQAPDPKNIKKELLRAELFSAITKHDLAGVKAALDHGANVTDRNFLEVTPLQWAAFSGERKIVGLLLARKAELDAPSIYGSAFVLAVNGRHPDIAGTLLDRGAKPNAGRIDNINSLMMAAMNGYTPLIQRLIKRKCDPNKQDNDGTTPLIYAARQGHLSAAKALLANGAKIDMRDSHGRTALMYAAQNGQAQMVNLLMSARASVNAKDKRGSTALLLAARYNGDPIVIASLLKRGATTASQDEFGKTAFSLCKARGYANGAAALGKAGASATVRTVSLEVTPTAKSAVENSVKAIQGGMKAFYDRTKCTSCHHQGLGLMALGAARKHGFPVDGKLIGAHMQRLAAEGKEGAAIMHQIATDPKLSKLAPAADIGDSSIGAAYLFGGMLAQGVPPNPGFADVALILANDQEADGRWTFWFDREPIQSSDFTTTALVLNVIRAYAPADQRARFDKVYGKARDWLLTAPPRNSEDKASKLLALKWAGANDAEIEWAVKSLVAAQKADGGWSPIPSLRSDAYATGLAVYALRVAGAVDAADPSVQKGAQFLLRTQDEDGSWYVNKRAIPANTYFDSGFPHGESQFISFGATCWAAMALMETMGSGQAASR